MGHTEESTPERNQWDHLYHKPTCNVSKFWNQTNLGSNFAATVCVLAVQPLVNYSTSLILSFPIPKMGTVEVSTLLDYCED